MARSGEVRPFEAWKIGLFGLIAAGFLAALAFLMTPPPPAGTQSAVFPPPVRHDRVVEPSFVHHFGGKHDKEKWLKSDFYYPNSPHPAWQAKLIHFKKNRVELEVRRRRVAYKNVAGAEYQRRGFYHYGRYEVVMRAAPGSGTVSAMFTHTHGQFGDPHDEIDIEFLGKDLTKLHANYFTNGHQQGGEYIPLGFDASKEVHLYAFEWDPHEIRWYVDDKLVHTARHADHPIPQAPGRLMVHLWSGTPEQYDWHGYPSYKNGARARFYCLSYRATGDRTEQCSDSYNPRDYRRR